MLHAAVRNSAYGPRVRLLDGPPVPPDPARESVPRRQIADRQSPQGRKRDGPEANARLTASAGVVLLVLLAAEGLTILKIRGLLTPHVFLGMLLIPPVLLKLGTTGYRFARYYAGSPAYRRRGPPPAVLRLLGPFVVLTTVVVFASGVALLYAAPTWRANLLLAHKASFVLWFIAMAAHVLGHLVDTARVAPRDWLRRTRRDVAGAGVRQWAIVASIALGIPLGLVTIGQVGQWLSTTPLHGG